MDKKIVESKIRYLRMPPRKVRLIVDQIRGRKAVDAAEILKFVNKAAALPVRKCLEAGLANAVNNFDLNREELYIVEARVDEAPAFKRGIAVSRGRYHQILKRNSHLIIKLATKDEPKSSKKVAKSVEKSTEKMVKSDATKKETKVVAKKEKTEKKEVKSESKPKKSSSKKVSKS